MDKITSLVPTFTRRSSTVSSISTQSSLDPTNAVVKNRRTRALTLPLETPQKVGLRRIKQQTLVQDSSPLVALPFELREQIYRIVLGGKCIAIDLHDRRIGDQSDPWPAYERPGGERRGIRPWGFKPDRKANILSLLLTCRQIYSEAIDLLYSANLFYFRNPLTNWCFSTFRTLPQRLSQIRVLVLDETVGDPAIVLTNRKQWTRLWRNIAKMTRLRVLYLNVDTLYPRAWTAEREQKLLEPLEALTQVRELVICVRWKTPSDLDVGQYPKHVGESLWRGDDYKHPDDFFAACPAAEMRVWIQDKLRCLEAGQMVGRKDGLDIANG